MTLWLALTTGAGRTGADEDAVERAPGALGAAVDDAVGVAGFAEDEDGCADVELFAEDDDAFTAGALLVVLAALEVDLAVVGFDVLAAFDVLDDALANGAGTGTDGAAPLPNLNPTTDPTGAGSVVTPLSEYTHDPPRLAQKTAQ